MRVYGVDASPQPTEQDDDCRQDDHDSRGVLLQAFTGRCVECADRPTALAEWMEPNNHQPFVGHKFKFVTDKSICGTETECDVLEAVAPRRLVWRWVSVSAG